MFGRAIALDDGMADAWLGMHAVGVDQDRAVQKMATHYLRFGHERLRNNFGLSSRFQIGTYVDYELSGYTEMWCAVAARHLARNEYGLADSALAHCDSSQPATFLRGTAAFKAGNHDQTIAHMRNLLGGDKYLKAEGLLLSAVALAEVGALRPAMNHLDWVLGQSHVPSIHGEALMVAGDIFYAKGNSETALSRYEEAYARNPLLPDLKEKLSELSSGTKVYVSRDRATPTGDLAETPDIEPAETVDAVLAELNSFVGQHMVKQQVRGLLAQIRAQAARQQAGIAKSQALTEHFVFTGPPGTGKTSVARTIARLYKALGILPLGHVVEVDRSGLIGEYHGQTVARTKAILDEATGGVLFIDEAYTLRTRGFTGGDPFGQEAIDTILKRMEDDRGKLVVIAAGYPEPMQHFLDSNPGLRSRFTTTVDFASYSVAELIDIAQHMAATNGATLDSSATAELQTILQNLDTRGGLHDAKFGNARFVRTVIEKSCRERDLRLFSGEHTSRYDQSELTTLISKDIQNGAATVR